MNKKSIILFTGLGVFAGSVCSNDVGKLNINYSYAANKKDVVKVESSSIMKEILNKYSFNNNYDNNFALYLNKNGIQNKDYQLFVSGNKKFTNSDVELFFRIENLTYIFDTAIYTNPVIKNIYKNYKSHYSDKDKAWEELKKQSVYDMNWLEKIFKDSLLNSVDMKKMYKQKFGKEPTKQELSYMSNIDTIKFALYSGITGKNLTTSDESIIKSGKGYELIGVNKTDVDEYRKHLALSSKVYSKQEKYIKTQYVHLDGREKFRNKYRIDIFNELSEEDRIEAYEGSFINYIHDKKESERLIESILKGRGYEEGGGGNEGSTEDEIPNEGVTPEVGGGITGDSSINKPIKPGGDKEDVLTPTKPTTDEDYDYIKDVLEDIGVDKETIGKLEYGNFTPQYYFNLARMTRTYSQEGNIEYVAFDVEKKDEEVEVLTAKTLNEDGKVSHIDLIDGLIQALSVVNGKVIESKSSFMIFSKNKIKIIKREDSYDLKELNKKLQGTGLKIKSVKIEELIKKYLDENDVKKEGGEDNAF